MFSSYSCDERRCQKRANAIPTGERVYAKYLFLRGVLGAMYFELDELFFLQQAVLCKHGVPGQPAHPVGRGNRSEWDSLIR